MPCFGQPVTNYKKLDDIKFKAIFGYDDKDSSNIYCLLGTGFIRTPRSDNFDSVIIDWMINHQNAYVIPVSRFGTEVSDEPFSKVTYCWVVDEMDTLNIHLIREGCFPGATMQRPKTWDEMEKWEKDLYEGYDKPIVKVIISDKEYDIFIEKIIEAETIAEKYNRGIWNKPDKKE